LDAQESNQDTLDEGLTTLLNDYTYKEEVVASIEPQELVDMPTQEQD
jgi:hypothetical protein